jgi:beta-glucosidase
MKKRIVILLIVFVILGLTIGMLVRCSGPSTANPGEDTQWAKSIEQQIDQMTLEEKVGQMTQITLSHLLKQGENGPVEPFELDPERLSKALKDYKVGSILNCGGHANSLEKWHEIISQIQQMATEETRLGIPVLYGIDAIHGANYTQNATLFPQQIAQAATWNPALVKEAASITAYETRASGIPWNFSPVLGLGRQPSWPRFWETFGEDVYLATSLGTAMVKGYQGETLSDDSTKVAACMKHYLGYSIPRTGKDRTPAWIPERQLRQYFLPPFVDAVEAGVQTAMVNSGDINGIPAHASSFVLKDLLKGELQFDGLVVSDWMDIRYLHTRHKIASTQKEAVRLAVNAGIDMSMVPDNYHFAEYLVELVEEGKISEQRIDDAVRRILKVKHQLGLYERPVTHYKNYPKFASDEFSQKNLATAEEAITLLKNQDATLPLKKNQRVLVTGPTANSMTALNGGWSYTWQGLETDQYIEGHHTILEAVEQTLGSDNVLYAPGSGFDTPDDIQKAVRQASNVDHVILCLGENAYCETPGNINDLYLPEAQQQLARSLAQTGKPVTLVLVQGRPRIISPFEQDMDAVVMSYLPGNRGGDAIARVLFGEVNPSGRLPFSYPRYPNALETYDHKNTEDIAQDGTGYNPQYPFGHGLSYTEFHYGPLTLSDSAMISGETMEASVEVTNTGDVAGKETVMMFISDHYASVVPAVKRLRGFQKIDLKPGESQKVTFEIDVNDLMFVGANNEWISEPGRFSVLVGSRQQDFELTNP